MINQHISKQNVFFQEDKKRYTSTLGIQVPQETNVFQTSVATNTRLEEPSDLIGWKYDMLNTIQNRIFNKTEKLRSRYKLYQFNSTNTIKKNNRAIEYLTKSESFEEVFL
jgi:hypothetical protein